MEMMMLEHFGKRLKKHYQQKSKVEHTYEGCSKAEIQEAMQAQEVKRLPKVYREFLETMGKQAGYLGLLWRSGIYYKCNHILYMKRDLRRQMKASFNLSMPDDIFVFYQDIGDTFLFFYTDNEDDDPPVYLFNDDESYFRLVSESLSEFFLEYAENYG